MEEYLKTQMDNIGQYIQDKSADFFINIVKGSAKFVIESSDIVCPIVCLLALAFYIGGNRKSGKVVSGTFIFYFLAQALKRFVVK